MKILLTALAGCALLLAPKNADALVITNDFSQLGSVYQDTAGLLYSSGGAGRTDVTAAFQANANVAAAVLERAIGAPYSFSEIITLGSLADLGAVGVSHINSFDANGRTATADVSVDTSNVTFFVDPTPLDNSEFGTFTNTNAALGGGLVNVSRIANAIDPGLASTGYDLLTLFLHEIEHNTGYNTSYPTFPTNNAITVPTSLSLLPSSFDIPVLSQGGGHIDGVIDNGLFNDTVIAVPGFNAGQRALLTGAEILGDCTVNACTANQVNTDPYAMVASVPEPTTWAIVVAGLGLTGLARRRRAARTSEPA